MSCNDNNNLYSQSCCPDTPYPNVQHESVPSLIDNLVYALYGEITKTVSGGRVVWNIPCDPAQSPAEVSTIPRNEGEGLLCYIMRIFQSTVGQFSPFSFWSFTGTGSQTTFSLSPSTITLDSSYLVYFNGVVQPPTAYNISNTNPVNIVFNVAPGNGVNISVLSLGYTPPFVIDVTQSNATPTNTSNTQTVGAWLAQFLANIASIIAQLATKQPLLPVAPAGQWILASNSGTLQWIVNNQLPQIPAFSGPFLLQTNGNGAAAFWNTFPAFVVDNSVLAILKQWPLGVSKTYYLSTRTDGVAGSGTLVDPYDVSDPVKWRTVISSLPNYCTIRLLAGNYSVCGIGYNNTDAAMWPDGCSVIGDGMDNTVLTVTAMSPNMPVGNRAYNVINIIGARQGGYGNPYITTPRQKGCVVSDLTVDCQWQVFRAANYKCGAIAIDGDESCSILRCRVKNFGGHDSGLQEAFPVSISGTNSLVEGCIIESPVVGVGDTDAYATYIAVGASLSIWQQIRRAVSSNAAANTFSMQQKFNNNDKFVFTSLTGGAPLQTNKIYYVVNVDQNANTWQLALTAGGTPIDFATITSAQGSGLQVDSKATVRNNICRGTSLTQRDGFGCILGSGYQSLTITGNKFENLAVGCYGDSWKNGSVYITQNYFRNCRRGMAAEMLLEQFSSIETMVVRDNIFDAYGANGSGFGPNNNLIGGWCCRLSGGINRFFFENNRIQSLDDAPIAEAGPFCGEVDHIVIRGNIIDTVCQRANPTPARISVIDEDNYSEIGTVRFLQPWGQSYYPIKANSGTQLRVTADAGSDILTVNGSKFIEGDIVYFYNLTGGSGLSADTRYFIRDLVTDAGTGQQTFKVYTQRTGGSPVDITGNYTSQTRISNKEGRNGLNLISATESANSYIGLAFDPNYNYRPQTATLLLYPGIYEWEQGPGAPAFGNFLPNFKVVGVGPAEDIIIRCWNDASVALSYGNVQNFYAENVTFQAWGPGAGAQSLSPGSNACTFKNCVFTIGGGATRAVGGGASGLGSNYTYIGCKSSAPLYDPVLNQGNSASCNFINCEFTGGVPPSAPGATYRNCVLASPIGINLGNGSMYNCKYTAGQQFQGIEINGGSITKSDIVGYIQVAGTGNKIHNTTVTTFGGTTNSIGITATPTIDIWNLATNRGIQSGAIITRDLTSPDLIVANTAPASAPLYVGQRYFNTSTAIMYLAFGTSSASDWQAIATWNP